MKLLPCPSHLYLEITTECQLRCRQCHYWRSREKPGALSLDEKRDLLHHFLCLNPKGVAVFTGGEPLLRLQELLELSSICRSSGVLSVVNTNGSLINPVVAAKLVDQGPSWIVVSLDSHREVVHDWLRGVPGTFQRAVSAIRTLVKARSRGAGATRIFLSSILWDKNAESCLEFASFAKRLGADGVTFQALEETFALEGTRDAFYENYWFKNPTVACRAIDRLGTVFDGDPFLLLSRRDREWLKDYIHHPDLLSEPVCGSHEHNLWVDMYGEARLCSYMHRLPMEPSVGNVREATILQIWTGELATKARKVMEGCRLPCGLLNCHRKTTLAPSDRHNV